jgi:hypothetical protein
MKGSILLACLAGIVIALLQAFAGLTTPAAFLLAGLTVAALVYRQVRRERAR